jgi:hypothetical protein
MAQIVTQVAAPLHPDSSIGDVIMVAELMGHKSSEMTRKYLQSKPIENSKATINLYD